MRVLITGANGYLGQGIVKAFLDSGKQIIATDICTNHIDDRAEKIATNLFELDNPYEELGKPDVVLHLAWRDGFVHYSDAHIEDMPKHYKFLKKMATSRIEKLVVMGSMHEIGFYEGSIDENTCCNPQSYYGISKNALRNITQLLAEQNNIAYQWLRGYYIVGNSEFGSSIFSKITAAAKRGETEFPFTQGLNQFDFIDYEDFCSQVATAVSQNEENGIINICSGRPEKLADRVERFIRENGFHIKLKYGAFPDRLYDSKAVWGNSTKIDYIMERNKK